MYTIVSSDVIVYILLEVHVYDWAVSTYMCQTTLAHVCDYQVQVHWNIEWWLWLLLVFSITSGNGNITYITTFITTGNNFTITVTVPIPVTITIISTGTITITIIIVITITNLITIICTVTITITTIN